MKAEKPILRPTRTMKPISSSDIDEMPVTTLSEKSFGRVQIIEAAPTSTPSLASTVEPKDLTTIRDLISRLGIDVVQRVLDQQKAELAGTL